MAGWRGLRNAPEDTIEGDICDQKPEEETLEKMNVIVDTYCMCGVSIMLTIAGSFLAFIDGP